MNWELDTILEQSISQIAEGKARVESCLLAYPAHADELGPLLLASEEMRAIPKPVISPAAKARIESQLFEAAAASGLVRRQREPLLSRLRPLILLPRWRPAYTAAAMMFIVVVLLMTTFVGAAHALPGSPFYPVKLATEDVWLWVAPARDEPAVHLRLAQRRLDEYKELAERGEYDEALLDAMVAHVDAALDGIEQQPPVIALELLDQAAQLVIGQRQELTTMRADLPAASWPQLDRVLGDAFVLSTRIEAIRWTMQPYGTVTVEEPTLEAVPTGTAEPGEILAATFTPTLGPATEETEELQAPTSTEPSTATLSGGAASTVPSAPTVPAEATSTSPAPTPVPTDTEAPSPAPTDTEIPPPVPTDTPVEPVATKKTPPGQTKTPEPPGLMTRTPQP